MTIGHPAGAAWWPGRAFPPGSFPWLMAHEIRMMGSLFRRRGEGKGGANRDVAVAFLVVYQLFYLLIAYPLASAPVREAAMPRLLAGGELLMTLFMLSGMLTVIVQWFNDRRDLDLLFSSPVSPRRVLAVRAIRMTVGGWVVASLGIGPLINGLALFGVTRWLVFYPVLLALALATAALAMLAIVPMLWLFGPRRAKLVIQIGSVLAFAGVFVSSQSWRFMPRSTLSLMLGSSERGADWVARLTAVRAMLGDDTALASMFALGGGLFLVAVMVLGPIFERAAAIEEAAPIIPGKAHEARRFHGSIWTILLMKELRLIRRFPGLWAQYLMSIAYVLPAFMALGSGRGFSGATVFVGFPVLMVGQVTQTIGWVTTGFDSAAELANSSPVARQLLFGAKVAATLLGAVSVMAIPLAVFIYARPFVAPAYFAGFLGVALTQLTVVFWASPPPAGQAIDTRLGFARVPRSAAILGQVTSLGWAIATGLMTVGSWWALAPIACTLFIIAALWEERQRRARHQIQPA